jgi:hypothetical protein
MPPNRTRPIIIRIAWSESEYAQVHAAAVAVTGGNVSEYVRRKTLTEDTGDGLRERVARLEAQLSKYAEMREQYDNLAALLAGRERLPRPDTTPPDWEGQPDYQYPGKHE